MVKGRGLWERGKETDEKERKLLRREE